MRTTTLGFLITAIALVGAAACSSSTAAPQNTGTGYGSGGSTTLFVGNPDHKRVSEACACEIYVAAVTEKNNALGGCLSSLPTCPDFVHSATMGADVDHGDVVACNT